MSVHDSGARTKVDHSSGDGGGGGDGGDGDLRTFGGGGGGELTHLIPASSVLQLAVSVCHLHCGRERRAVRQARREQGRRAGFSATPEPLPSQCGQARAHLT